ncbi:EAL domain-containing protein [Burkholderiaceae bacterium DAT-1]|nr:EAL domain-containing protein [Burkholderiaceae bacterium DAT-1]
MSDSNLPPALPAGQTIGNHLCGELFDATRAPILVIDPDDGSVLDANGAAAAFYGWPVAQLRTMRIFDINVLPPNRVAEEMQHAAAEGRRYFHFDHRLASGAVRAVDVYASTTLLNERPVIISMVHDSGLTGSMRQSKLMALMTIEAARFGVLWFDREGLVVFANATVARMTGAHKDELIGQKAAIFSEQMAESDWQRIWERTMLTGVDTFRAHWNTKQRTGLIEVSTFPIQYSGQIYLVATIRDLASMSRLDQLLDLQYRVIEALAEGQALDTILDLITSGVDQIAPELISSIVMVDEQGYLRPGSAPGLPQAYCDAINGLSIGPDVGSCGTAAWLRKPVFVRDIAHDPLWAAYKDLALQHGLRACWSSPILTRLGQVQATFAIYYREVRDADRFHRRVVDACVHLVTLALSQREAEAQIHHLAFFDPLTGLPNRAMLAERAQHSILRAEREGRSMALLYVDLDRFKNINDSLGHQTGDAFLDIMGHRLDAVVREYDTVGRIGADEFVIVLANCNRQGAERVAGKVIGVVNEPITLGEHILVVGASIGIAVYPEDGADFESLMRNADTAMHQAKASPNRVFRFYHEEMNQAAAERLRMEAALRTALDEGQLLAHYQPQILIRDESLYGVEALARWMHPEWGMISPARFIPLAEETGLIEALGSWMLRETVAQLARWDAQGVRVPSLSVNLSPQQFRQEGLEHEVAALLDEFGIAPDRLTLEITESVMMLDEYHPLETLKALKQLGVCLSVDDFGTGYSSLSYLKRFPVHELKLDQSFVRDLGEDAEDRALASAVVRIGQSLNLSVVAEGVETAVQLAFLKEQGCDVAQGWLFARPMEASALSEWFWARQASPNCGIAAG